MYPNIHSNTIYNNQDMEATQMSINRQMDKEDTHTHTEEYYSVIKKTRMKFCHFQHHECI